MTALQRVTALIDRGADVKQQYRDTETPLAIAIKRGHPDVADRICRAGGR